MIHLFDHHGTMLHVDYSPGTPITLHSVHVTDSMYRPVGPDLTIMLHNTLVPIMATAQNALCQTFLSSIIDSIEEDVPHVPN